MYLIVNTLFCFNMVHKLSCRLHIILVKYHNKAKEEFINMQQIVFFLSSHCRYLPMFRVTFRFPPILRHNTFKATVGEIGSSYENRHSTWYLPINMNQM